MTTYAKKDDDYVICIGSVPAGYVEVDESDYNTHRLSLRKEERLNEACNRAKEHLEGGYALYAVDDDNHIEATDGNIGKLTSYALAFITGTLSEDDTVEWTTKEDNVIELTQSGLSAALSGLGAVQAEVWNVKYPAYLEQINAAATLEELESIEIEY
ncbi:MAG: hypothetical protein LUB59_00395 [Candidatus Gastranaerophilales bacterium]|nr:hypothetical protein [Candidatus Gastranaerophilales bacterium]